MNKLLIATILSTSIAISASASDHSHSHNDHEGRIGFEKAKEIAIKTVKDSIEIEEAELEIDEDGEASYEIEVNAGGVTTEIEIDAKTGEVLEMGADD